MAEEYSRDRAVETLAEFDVPTQVRALAEKQMAAPGAIERRPTLEEAFVGMDPSTLTSLRNDGMAIVRNNKGQEQFLATQLDEEGRIVFLAAGIPREPGRSEDFLEQIREFQEQDKTRGELITLLRRVYRREGVANNAVNKSASLIATDGSYKIRSMKGQRGKRSGQPEQELLDLLTFWKDNVNGKAMMQQVTTTRGVSAIISHGARQALIEGDNVIREVWGNVQVPVLAKSYKLPTNLQFYPADHITIPEELVSTGYEMIFWTPPREVIRSLTQPQDQEVAKIIKKIIPSKVLTALERDQRYLFDPQLIHHVRHRGTGSSVYGESMLEAALSDVAYKRALQALDTVTIENLINRLVIIAIGSDDNDSVYHTQGVTNERLGMLQRLMQNIGPSSTILWPGPDIQVIEVGAYNQILAMDDRYQQAEGRIRSALGVPAALLTGEASDGKAAAWAASTGLAAQLRELQDQYKALLIDVGKKIAMENGFEDVDLTWVFHRDLLVNKEQNAAITMQAYQLGLLPVYTALAELGFDPDPIIQQMIDEVENFGWRDEAFGPPRAAITTNPAGAGGGNGRPDGNQRPGKTDPRDGKETQTQDENK